MTNNKLHRTGQPDGQHHNTHPVYHLQHLISTTPLHTTRPEPYCTLQQLTHAELITPARKTIAQLARTQHPYPNHIPNRYYRHFQRYFDPDAAFQHLFRHTLHAVPTDHPYTIALDGTTVPRTGAYIPGAHWTPNPANAPFARGLRKAQRFVMAGWLDDDPNARCVPIYWLPTFSLKARYANPASRRSEIQGWIASLQHVCARVARRGRARRATAAVCGRRTGRYRSVGQAGLASHGLLCAHTPRLARERPAQRHPIGSGASARGERPSVAAARQGASGAVVVEGVAALGVGGGVRWMQRGFGLGEKPCWGLDGEGAWRACRGC
jgi:hypothetical protein